MECALTAGKDVFSGDSSIVHETWPEYLRVNGLPLLFLVLFWAHGMSVIRSVSHRTGHRWIQWRNAGNLL
jgi:hypothetical protein